MQTSKLGELSKIPFDKKNFPWKSEAPPLYFIKNPPKISIITPSFNQGKFIEDTICSIISQNYPNLEYIIIDGGSTDDTISIIKKYDKWIHYWVSETDEGQSDAINKGLAHATGEIFNWLNSDDLLAPNALWEIALQFSKNKQTEVLIGMLQVFDENSSIEYNYQMQYLKDIESTISFGEMSQPSLFFRLEKIKLLRGVDKHYHYCMDLDLWYRYLLSFGIKNILVIEQTFAYYRNHNATKSSNIKIACNERLILMLTILDTLGMSQKDIETLKPESPKIEDYYKDWDLNASFLDKSKLRAYLLEQILVIPQFDFPLFVSYKFWIRSFKIRWKGRRPYFFTLPLRFIYRKFKKYYSTIK